MDWITPGFPVHHQLPELTQTHAHWLGGAIQTSHPLSFPVSHLQSCPASESLQMSPLFSLGGQSNGVSASTSALPMNIQDCFPLGLTSWISLQSKGLSRVFSNTMVQKHQSSAFFIVQLSHPYMTTGKTIAFTRENFAGQLMSLLFNTLSRFVIAFLPRSKCLLIS